MTLGEKIGPHEVTGFLGEGGMGEVHRARDPRLGREVAIKTLPASLGLDPERIRRFDVEVRSAGSLNDANVLTIYDTGTLDGVPYLVSELLEGHTLRTRLKDGPLPLRRAIDLAAQAARGLSAAHGRGIIHRDLKPENLFVTNGGTLKILDFGLAKLVEKSNGAPADSDSFAGTMTGAGYFMGTVGYMAPEQARGLPATPATDLFALGCGLYEMVTGIRAYHKDNPVDTMMAILNEDPAPLPARVRAEAPGFSAILQRCLEKQPGERFESARDLAFALSLLGNAEAAAPANGEAPSLPGKVESRVTFHRLTFRRGSILRARFTPDGRYIAARTGKAPMTLYPVDGGDPLPMPGLRSDDTMQAWKLENDAILVASEGELPARIHRIELATGARTLWREISPPDPSGVWSTSRFHFQPDGQTYGYTYHLQLDDLYLVENLR